MHIPAHPSAVPIICAHARCPTHTAALQWERVIIGPDEVAPAYALVIMLAVVTLNGVLDGLAVGAIFGEMAILGPSAAHVGDAKLVFCQSLPA
jgi:hypothetical protein